MTKRVKKTILEVAVFLVYLIVFSLVQQYLNYRAGIYYDYASAAYWAIFGNVVLGALIVLFAKGISKDRLGFSVTYFVLFLVFLFLSYPFFEFLQNFWVSLHMSSSLAQYILGILAGTFLVKSFLRDAKPQQEKLPVI